MHASVIHFATHALVDPLDVAGAALLLAGDDDEHALLRTPEIESQALQADLVSLSGCSTGSGYVIQGEGTLGLARSFFVAGARSVVMSLWDVEDGAARRCMEAFYEGLKRGEPRDVALQHARATMKREGFPHRDRSAFVLAGYGAEPVIALVGEAGARRRTPTLLIMAAIVVLLVVLLGVRLMRRR
jgi:CHAT domain-containing protein